MGGNDNFPKCPLCGSSMVKRVAKKGTYSGQEFWSCSQYFTTKCKGIIIISSNTNNHDTNQNVKQFNPEFDLNEINHIIPINFYAIPLFDNFESCFYQSLVIPYSYLKEINSEKMDIQGEQLSC